MAELFEKLQVEYMELVRAINDNREQEKLLKAKADEAKAIPKKALARCRGCEERGDEEGRIKAMAEIRASQKKISEAVAEHDRLQAEIPILYDRRKKFYQKLLKPTTEARERWEEIPRRLEIEFKNMVLLQKRTETMLDSLDKLAKRFPAKEE